MTSTIGHTPALAVTPPPASHLTAITDKLQTFAFKDDPIDPNVSATILSDIHSAWTIAQEAVRKKCNPAQQKIIDECHSADQVIEQLKSLAQRQASRKSLDWVTKMNPFLDGLKMYDDVMKTYCNSGVRELALVWGSITLVLQVCGRIDQHELLSSQIKSGIEFQ